MVYLLLSFFSFIILIIFFKNNPNFLEQIKDITNKSDDGISNDDMHLVIEFLIVCIISILSLPVLIPITAIALYLKK